MPNGAKLDSELLDPLSKATHQELERIVEYLDTSPVILVKSSKEYKENKNDLTKIYKFIVETVLDAGGYGVVGFKISEAEYKDIVFSICDVAKLSPHKSLNTQELETRFLNWAFSESKKIKPELPVWDGRSVPPEDLVFYTRDNLILGYKKPDLLSIMKEAFETANDFLGNQLKLLLQLAGPLLLWLNNQKANAQPGWKLTILEGVAAVVATVMAAGTAGPLAAGGAVAGAYAALLSVYTGIALAGPATAALFPCVFDIALLRLKE